jgi:hypothetical protein
VASLRQSFLVAFLLPWAKPANLSKESRRADFSAGLMSDLPPEGDGSFLERKGRSSRSFSEPDMVQGRMQVQRNVEMKINDEI